MGRLLIRYREEFEARIPRFPKRNPRVFKVRVLRDRFPLKSHAPLGLFSSPFIVLRLRCMQYAHGITRHLNLLHCERGPDEHSIQIRTTHAYAARLHPLISA